MNPSTVASARTARLAREASAPVYSTRTGDPIKWRKADDELRAWRDRAPVDPFAICDCEDC